MAESNLRTMLIAAKGSARDVPMGDAEMEAILGVLKTEQNGPSEGAPGTSAGTSPTISEGDTTEEARANQRPS